MSRSQDASTARTVSGAFDVEITPVDKEDHQDGVELGRFSLDKTYHGELEATGRGTMLTAGTPVEGSAGYVALERVEGELDGRRGSFVLQHLGRMGRGEEHLDIRVLRDSATGELEGLEGRLDITIEDNGDHVYRLEYTLDPE